MTQIPFWPFVAVLVFLAGCIDRPHRARAAADSSLRSEHQLERVIREG